ncbi:hypothetical protein C8R44DRAFT_551699, partial [Mycena epipterygia]
WPARFHVHFYVQMWCTYRAGFEPIRDLSSLASLPCLCSLPRMRIPMPMPTTTRAAGTRRWGVDERCGVGCMLRTAQSLLATALQRVGVSSFSSARAALSWLLDAPAAPFGVHRMALAGKAAGKDVGMRFGPSAAGAVR